jgi:Na+-transporting NADH:ubiquinone oxidoreductase subunit C
MTSIVAVILAFMSTVLRPAHDRNEALYNKRAIIQAVDPYLEKPVAELTDEEIQAIFDNKIVQKVVNINGEEIPAEKVAARGYDDGQAEDIDMAKERKRPESERYLPVFIYDNKYYIVSVRGNGLWDEIWGNIAIQNDFNTIAGATFDHAAETPGLGAEIKDDPNFSKQMIGKELYNEEGEYVSVEVLKGKAPAGSQHKVDGITGATITSVGVSEMLDRGIKYYEPYFEKVKN